MLMKQLHMLIDTRSVKQLSRLKRVMHVSELLLSIRTSMVASLSFKMAEGNGTTVVE